MLSRVADHLYWMSRYLERAEHTARLIDVSLNLMLEQSPAVTERRWRRLMRSLYLPPADEAISDYIITEHLTFDHGNPNAIVSCIAAARENAQHVRELISSEMWEQLNEGYLGLRQVTLDDIWSNPHPFFRRVKESVHLFEGITDSTMTQGEGWQFIQIGRLIERTSMLASLLDQHFRELPSFPGEGDATSEYLEWVGLLKCCTAFEAYCKVYGADLKSNCIAEFLLLNADFPHSVCFSVSRMQAALRTVADITETHRAGRLNKLSGRLAALLQFGQIDEILDGGLHPLLAQVESLCMQIHGAIYQTYISYPIERELAG